MLFLPRVVLLFVTIIEVAISTVPFYTCPDKDGQNVVPLPSRYRCIFAVTSGLYSSSQAFTKCNMLGATSLLTIDNSEDQEYLEYAFNTSDIGTGYWIGLSYDSERSRMVWQTGISMNYEPEKRSNHTFLSPRNTTRCSYGVRERNLNFNWYSVEEARCNSLQLYPVCQFGLYTCGGIVYNDPNVCSGNGECESTGECKCTVTYSGLDCANINMGFYLSLAGGCFLLVVFTVCCCCVVIPIIVIVLLIIVVCVLLVIWVVLLVVFVGVCVPLTFFCCILVCCGCICTFVCCCVGFCMLCCCKKKEDNFDSIDRELKRDTKKKMKIANISINEKLFEIKYENLKVSKMLGEGGSDSTVFLCKWKNKSVAFKCFKTHKLFGNQENFDEFEKEVSILSSIRHPNCLDFFGCTLKPPRVGIVMEFCSMGDMKAYLTKVPNSSLDERLRWLHEVADALEYLHDRNVIHRDLKCENVLLNKNLVAKVIDFGLSRVVDTMSVTKTSQIGTSFYMAPEIALGESKYDEKVDVFSYSIMMWEMLANDFNPFGYDSFNIERRIANNNHYRPRVQLTGDDGEDDENENDSEVVLKGEVCEKYPKLIICMQKSWQFDPEIRPSFQEIRVIFDEVRGLTDDSSASSGDEPKNENDEPPTSINVT